MKCTAYKRHMACLQGVPAFLAPILMLLLASCHCCSASVLIPLSPETGRGSHLLTLCGLVNLSLKDEGKTLQMALGTCDTCFCEPPSDGLKT